MGDLLCSNNWEVEKKEEKLVNSVFLLYLLHKGVGKEEVEEEEGLGVYLQC